MIRKTPFHERTSALNETGLWSHWSGHLVVDKYQMSEKFEYFAIRNSAGMFDSSPALQVPHHGQGRREVPGRCARPRHPQLPAGQGPVHVWFDDRGFVIEDGVILRTGQGRVPADVGRAQPRLLQDLIGYDWVEIEEVSADIGTLAFQGPRSRDLLAKLVPEMDHDRLLRLRTGKIGDAPVTMSRTGFTGDLGYEIWIDGADALQVWDTLWEAMEGHGVLPFGQTALLMLRIEAGLLLLNVDFESSRFAWNDEHRSTPIELGSDGCSRTSTPTTAPFIGRKAIGASRRQDLALGDARADGRLAGVRRNYNDAGLVPPKDHTPVQED